MKETEGRAVTHVRALPVEEGQGSRGSPGGAPSPSEPRGRFALGIADVYVAIALLVILIAVFVPFSFIDGVSPCTFFVVTGIPCPGCGFTRSFMRAANLDISGALLVSPFGTFLFLGLVLVVILGVSRIVLRRPWPRLDTRHRGWRLLGISVGALLLVNWIYLLIRHLIIGDWA